MTTPLANSSLTVVGLPPGMQPLAPNSATKQPAVFHRCVGVPVSKASSKRAYSIIDLHCFPSAMIEINSEPIQLNKLQQLTSSQHDYVRRELGDGRSADPLDATLHPLVVHAVVQESGRRLATWTVHTEAQLETISHLVWMQIFGWSQL